MARKKRAGLIVGVAAAAVVAAVAVSTLGGGSGGGTGNDSRDTIDAGGGALAAPSATSKPYAISTLSPVGAARQDPGGGGGGDGARPGSVGAPGALNPLAQGSVSTTGLGPQLFLSSLNLLDPTRSAVTTGDNTFPSATSPLTTTVGTITGALPSSAPLSGGSPMGCAQGVNSVAYYAIPLNKEKVGFSGTPTVHLRISGPASVRVQLMQERPDENCQLISEGSAPVRGGVADVTLTTRRNFTFAFNNTPSLVITAAGTSNTVSTSRQNPSFITLPNVSGL